MVEVEAPWHKNLEDNSEGEMDGEQDISDGEFEGTTMEID
jgi:hypothetical protein